MTIAIEPIPRERSFKNWGKRQAAQLGAMLTRLRGTQTDDAFAIFNFHRISPLIRGIPAPTINVAPDRFREQIAGLQRRGYVIRSLAEIVRLQRLRLPMPPRTVVLTIDDGFASVYKHALPILIELQAPATLFLCTTFLDTDAPFPFDPWARNNRRHVPVDDWRPLRTDECREMLASGLIEFGVHTHRHEDFRLRPRDFADDLRTCQRILGDKFGVAADSFAFPFGYYSEPLMDVVRQSNLTCALTVDARLVHDQADPFGWARFDANGWDTSATLAAKREGWYGWFVDRYQSCGRIARRIARRPPRQIAAGHAIQPTN